MIGQIGVQTVLPQPPYRFPLRDALYMLASSMLAPVVAPRFTGYDVFIGCNQPGAWLAWTMCRILARPYVVYLNQPNRLLYPRRVDEEVGWEAGGDYALLRGVTRFLRPFVTWADHVSITRGTIVLANGEYIARAIQTIYGRAPRTCPAGCRPSPIHELAASPEAAYNGHLRANGYVIPKPFVLITNRHQPQKRFEHAILAMSHVLREVPNTCLVVPGPETRYTGDLRRWTARLGLAKKVLFVGAVTEAQLQQLYAQAAVYCYPAPEEDFGMGVIESMAHGVPVVAWKHGGPATTIVHGVTGLLAESYDIQDYAAKIADLLNAPRRRHEMGRTAHHYVSRNYTWERHNTILASAIEEAIRRSRVAPSRDAPDYHMTFAAGDCKREREVTTADPPPHHPPTSSAAG